MPRRQYTKLTGGLPFPPPPGGKRSSPARPLAASKQALSPAQAKTESSHQQSAIVWLNFWGRRFPVLLRTFHVANEHAGDGVEYTKRDGSTGHYSSSGQRRKAEGVKPSIFDLLNLANARGFSGLAVDLKVRTNELTNEPDKEWDQVRESAWLISQGKSAHVAWSWAEVAALHAWYFELRDAELWRSIGRFEMWLTGKGGHDRRCGCQINLENYSRRLKEER